MNAENKIIENVVPVDRLDKENELKLRISTGPFLNKYCHSSELITYKQENNEAP